MSATKGSPRLTVVKVGGSLLDDTADLRRVASALAERCRDGGSLLVVGSALKGVTDLLELTAFQALDRRRQNGHLRRTLAGLRRRHLELAHDLADGDPLPERVRGALDQVEALVGSIRATGELRNATYARLLSCGERLSVTLLAAAVRAAGGAAQPIAAEEAGLRAKGPPCAGSCDIPASAAGLQRMRRLLRDRVLVLTGFYGIDDGGGVVLFGRGGSDNTAGAVAAGLDADCLELWKDVPGFMSADPREVRGARLIAEISFDEVAQLGAYGSRIVNHGCLEPLLGRATRVFVSSLEGARSGSGTVLAERPRRAAVGVVALAGRRTQTELRLASGPGDGVQRLAGRALNALAGAQVPIRAFDTPQGSARFVVAEADADRAWLVLRELANGFEVGMRRSPALVGVVGEGVADDPEIRSRMLACLSAAGVRGDLTAQPSGCSGLSCTVHQDDLVPALSHLHEHFFAASGDHGRSEAPRPRLR